LKAIEGAYHETDYMPVSVVVKETGGSLFGKEKK
jgi:hypothetical protein